MRVMGRSVRNDTAAAAQPARTGAELTLRKLKVFQALAQSRSMTRAAKLLGVTQPSLSQQLASLEAAVGSRLFDRTASEMTLTDAGTALLEKSERILSHVQEIEDGLPLGRLAARQKLRVAGVPSVMRMVLPPALDLLRAPFPEIEYDLHETSPNEVLDMLYSRGINIGLLAANAVAEASAGFQQVPILTDPYVLVVPDCVELAGVTDPARSLSADQRAILNASVRFEYGNLHSRRTEEWFTRVMPQNRQIARARSFELAVELVRGGLGVCLAPALSAVTGRGRLDGVRLYSVDLEPRRVVAMLPAQYRRVEPYSAFLGALQQAGAARCLPPVAAMPPFVAAARRGSA